MHDDTHNQIKIFNYLISDARILAAIVPILQPAHFDERLRKSIRTLQSYYNGSGKLPDVEIFNPPQGLSFTVLKDIDVDYAISEAKKFIKNKAYTHAINSSVDHLDDNDFDAIHRLFDEAQHIDEDGDDFGMVYGSQVGTIEPPAYLISPWLVKDTVTAVYGAAGSFKSFLLQSAALQLAKGIDGCEKISVCYVAAEGASGANLRAEAWLQYHKQTLNEREFAIATKPIILTNDASVASFIHTIKKMEKRLGIDYGLIIIDTLSQCTPGADENSAQDMSVATSNMIRIRRELETTVVFVHHSGKQEDKEMRGSSAIKANTDAMIEVKRTGATSGVALVRRQKDAPIGQAIPFELKTVEIERLRGKDLGNSLVCVTSSPEEVDEMTPMRKLVEMKLLRDIADAVGLNQTKSVHAINMKLGRGNTTSYKKAIADLTPLDTEVVVQMRNGTKAKLIRTAITGFGDIEMYEYKSESNVT